MLSFPLFSSFQNKRLVHYNLLREISSFFLASPINSWTKCINWFQYTAAIIFIDVQIVPSLANEKANSNWLLNPWDSVIILFGDFLLSAI